MLELRDLRALTAVIEAGGMARAGERLHLVQSAVSQAIKRLEIQVGQPLLERRRTGIVPTPAGVALNRHAQLILNYVARAEEDMRAYRGLTRGSVRLGILSTASPFLLGPLLRHLAARHPGLLLHVEDDLADALLDRVRSGSLDLSLVYLPTEVHGLTVEEVKAVRLSLMVPRTHHLGSRKKVSLHELSGDTWISFEEGNPARRWLEDNCARAGFRPRVTVGVQSVHQLLAYVAAEVGVGMLPPQAAILERRDGAVRVLEIADPVPKVMIGYAYDDRQPSPAILAVRTALAEVLSAAVA